MDNRLNWGLTLFLIYKLITLNLGVISKRKST